MRVRLKRKIYFSFSSFVIVSKEVELPMDISPMKGMYLEDGNVMGEIDMVKIYSMATFFPGSYKITTVGTGKNIEVWLTSEEDMDKMKMNREKRLDYLSERKEFYEKEGWEFQESLATFAAFADRKLSTGKIEE